MPQVMDPDILEPRTGADALPEGLQITERLSGQCAGDDPRVAVDAPGVFQILDRWGAEMDDFLAGFGVWQAQGALGEVTLINCRGSGKSAK